MRHVASLPADRMVVVTGDPRSGTSLMMQTLHWLGVPVAGAKFPREETPPAAGADEDERQRRIARARQMNPRGFFEVPGVVLRGTRSLRSFGGKALKIISPGAYPRRAGGRMKGTPTGLVFRYIMCIRDPRHVARSQAALRHDADNNTGARRDMGSTAGDPTRYTLDNGGLLNWLARQSDEDRAAWLIVDYDAFLADPQSTIERIVAHLHWTGRRRAAAIANVDPTLRRAACRRTRWPRSLQRAGETAERIYLALKSEDPALMCEAARTFVEFRQHLRSARSQFA